MDGQQLVDLQEMVWQSIDDLCETFTEKEWKLPTDCPGWSVQDQVSHLAGSEATYLGRPVPDHVPKDTPWVRNEIGARNEVQVDWRRPRSGREVLDEFREVTRERLRLFRGMSQEDFEAQTQTPLGPGTINELIRIRIMDAWVHEQDVRRAVGRPGDLAGPVAEHSVGRFAMAMPFVVGKKAGAGDGTTVVFDVQGDAGRQVSINVEGGRAKEVDAVPETPSVRLTMDVETFACLGCGRLDPDEALRAGKVEVDGHKALGDVIVANMRFMI